MFNTNKIQIEYREKEMSVRKALEIDEEVVTELEKLRDVIALLLKESRRHLLNEAFGIDAKRVKSFSENDRGEDRN